MWRRRKKKFFTNIAFTVIRPIVQIYLDCCSHAESLLPWCSTPQIDIPVDSSKFSLAASFARRGGRVALKYIYEY